MKFKNHNLIVPLKTSLFFNKYLHFLSKVPQFIINKTYSIVISIKIIIEIIEIYNNSNKFNNQLNKQQDKILKFLIMNRIKNNKINPD